MSKHFQNFNQDERAVFANQVLKLLWYRYTRITDNPLANPHFLIELKSIYRAFDEHVRNIYEIIDDQIPLFAYYQVLKDGHNGYNMWEEFESKEDALAVIESCCVSIYR
jgi:hypothetical protein